MPLTRSRRTVELTLAFVVTLSAVAIDVSIPAIPLALDDLAAAAKQGQLMIAVYLMGYGAGQIPFGLFADRYGRMPSLRVGLLIFLAASLATVLAPSIEFLLISRLVQGFGGAAAAVVARAIARDLADGAELARLSGLLVSALAIATLVAPIIGSAVIMSESWRGVFGVSLFMAALALILMNLNLQETRSPGVLASTVSAQLAESLQAFLGSTVSILGAIIVAFTFFAYMGVVAGIAQVTVSTYCLSSSAVGVVFSGAVVFYVAAGRIGAGMAKTEGAPEVLRTGIRFFIVTGLSCSYMLYVESPTFWLFWLALLPFFCGLGFVFPAATAITLEPLPEVAGFAASILGTFQVFAGALGAAATSMFYDGSPDSVLGVVVTGCVAAVLIFFAALRSCLVFD